MAMHVLALAVIAAKRVAGRKCLLDANLKHSLFVSESAVGPLLLLPSQKPRNLPQFLRGRISRERLQENFTIRHPLNPAIEQRQHAAIGLCPNEASKPLLQGEHRLRHLEFRERVAPILLQSFHARGDNRVAGHRKGQPIHNNARELIPRHVDALPETRSGKQHRTLCVPESFEQRRSRRRSLQEQRKRHAPAHALEQIIHLRIAGEQTKGASLADLQQFHDFIRRRLRKSRVPHVRNSAWQIQKGLFCPIKLRWQRSFLCVIESQALPDELEAPGDRECGGGQHDGVELFEQPGAENLTHVYRRSGQKNALASALVPVDEIAFVRFQQKGQLLANFETPARDAQQFLGLLRHGRKFGFQSFQRVRQSVVSFALLLQERRTLVSFEGITAIARGEGVKKGAAALANPLCAPQQRGRREVQQPHGDVGVACQFLKAIVRNLPAKIIAGYIFHFVRFVKHDRRIFRQDASEIVLLECEVREKQMMIYDDQIRFLGALLHGGDEALLKLRTFLSRAGISPRVDSRPKLRIVGQKRKLGAIAGFRQLGPILNLTERIHLLNALKNRLVGNLMQLGATQEIRAPLHDCYFQLGCKVLLQKRNVFLIELLLQRLGGGGDHHAASAANRRQQIRQRLTRAGSGFDH